MDFSKLSDDQLLVETSDDFALERTTSKRILFRLKEIKSRHLYAKRGYHNMFWMLIKYFKQSETSANQKLKTLDLMMDVPVVEERLASGELNLSTVSMAQRQINREEKITGKKVSQEKKAEIIEAITDKTMAQAEVELFKQLPETATKPAETAHRISEDTTRMGLNFPDDVTEMLNRLKDRWAHVDPTMENIEVIRRAFKIALQQIDPMERKKRQPKKKQPVQNEKRTSSPEQNQKPDSQVENAASSNESKTQRATESAKHRSNERLTYYGKDFDAELWQRAGSRCEFIDDKTGKRCDCTFGLEREHVISLALDGKNELSNMQLLCKTHNLLRARTVFGKKKIDSYTNKNGRSR